MEQFFGFVIFNGENESKNENLSDPNKSHTWVGTYHHMMSTALQRDNNKTQLEMGVS